MNTFFKGWQIPNSMRIIMTLLIYNSHCSVFQSVVFKLIWTFLKIGKVCTLLLFSQSDSSNFFKCTCIITKQKVCNQFLFLKLITANALSVCGDRTSVSKATERTSSWLFPKNCWQAAYNISWFWPWIFTWKFKIRFSSQ